MGDGSLGALGQVGGPTGDSPQGPGFDSEKLVETCGHLLSKMFFFQVDFVVLQLDLFSCFQQGLTV